MDVGWIGLGRIGLPMAERLILAGHEVWAWDASATATEEAVRLGARRVAGVREMTGACRTVFLCLPDVQAVEAVVFGRDGLASHGEDLIIVDHTSMSPAQAEGIARRAARDLGFGYVDAPISGGPAGARSASLVCWLGGAPEPVGRVGTYLQAYCSRVLHMGASGQGQRLKACNQLIAGAMLAAWSEALRFAGASGLDPLAVTQSLKGASADSPLIASFGDALATRTFPAKSTANFIKDLSNLLDLANEARVPLPIAQAALAEFRCLSAELPLSSDLRGDGRSRRTSAP